MLGSQGTYHSGLSIFVPFSLFVSFYLCCTVDISKAAMSAYGRVYPKYPKLFNFLIVSKKLLRLCLILINVTSVPSSFLSNENSKHI